MVIKTFIEEIQHEAATFIKDKGKLEWYIFGSALYDVGASDIDILVVYSSIEDPMKIRVHLRDLILKYPLDFTFLTNAEALELDFITATKAKRIYP